MIRARFNYNPGCDNFDLWITEKSSGQLRFLTVETVASSIAGENAKPFLKADHTTIEAKEFAQAIIDAAWEIGIRPSGYKDVLNETTAIKLHLNDMRQLVFAGQTPYNIDELK